MVTLRDGAPSASLSNGKIVASYLNGMFSWQVVTAGPEAAHPKSWGTERWASIVQDVAVALGGRRGSEARGTNLKVKAGSRITFVMPDGVEVRWESVADTSTASVIDVIARLEAAVAAEAGGS